MTAISTIYSRIPPPFTSRNLRTIAGDSNSNSLTAPFKFRMIFTIHSGRCLMEVEEDDDGWPNTRTT